MLKKLTDEVKRPYVVALGGAKVSDKLAVIDQLLGKADRLLIGGGMAYTFLKAKGYEVGISLLQEDQIPAVKEYIERAEKNGVELVLPVDVLVAPEFPDLKTKAPANPTTVAADAIPADQEGLDIGPETRKLYASKLADAGTVFWNGPMGVFEHPDYAEGTKAVAQALVDAPGFTVVGGGDSAAAVRTLGFDENAFGHISTGGGASSNTSRARRSPASPHWRTDPDDHPHAADGGQLEDEPQPPGGHRPRPEARLRPRGQGLRRRRGRRPRPFTDLRSVQTLVDGDKLKIKYGAQDISAHDGGAYTGEISGPMLAKLKCTYVAVGHSERRQYHAETDEIVNAKVKAAYKHGLTPILCVGEELDVREAGNHVEHTLAQVEGGLKDLAAEQAESVVIAYEPVWAIGTGKVCGADDAQEVCAAIRGKLAELYSQELADKVRIQYGGSVKSGNVAEIMAKPDIDGALVGGASLDSDEFVKIVRFRDQ